MSHNRFQHSNFREVFGELESVHRVRRGWFESFVVPAMVVVCFLFAVLLYVSSEDWLVIPICVAPFFLLFCGVGWHLIGSRRDELRIYENGFTNQSGRKLQTCLWTEIKEYKRRELTAREITELKNGESPLGSIEKKTGEIIAFGHDLPGTTEIINRFENRKKK
jgi:hypothetical protein